MAVATDAFAESVRNFLRLICFSFMAEILKDAYAF
jgi:hypothetical protein